MDSKGIIGIKKKVIKGKLLRGMKIVEKNY